MSRKVQQRKGDDSPLILAGAVILALVATCFGYPGFVLVPIGVTIAAYIASPPELTDKKNGRPVPANDSESAKLRKYHARQSLKSTFFNPQAWWPGTEVRLSWFVFLSLSIIVGMIPAHFDHFGLLSDYDVADHIFGLINAIAIFITITAYDDASRRFASEDEPRPAVGWKDLKSALPKTLKVTAEVPNFIKLIAAHGLQIIVLAIYVVVGVVATIAAGFGLRILAALWESFIGHSLTTYGLPTLAFAACGGIGLTLMLIAAVVRPKVISSWRLREAARAEWKPRWADLKFDPAPGLTDRRQLSAGLVDTFRAPAGKGAMTFIDKESDIIPALGAGQSAAVIESPHVNALGQEVEGSIHPNEFRVVQIPSDSVPDAFDTEADPEVARLAAILSWKPRWASLKFKPAPRLISREIVGSFAVDTFDAPQGRSATEFMTTHAAKVTPTLGAGVSGAILSIADQNGVHPTQFRVVASKTDQASAITDPTIGDEELSIALESVIATVCNDAQYARPDIASIVPLHDESSPVAAWYVGLSIDPGIVRHMRLKGGLQSQFAAKLGCVAALNDNPERKGGLALYVGAFDSDELSPNDSGRQMLPEVAGVREEDWWNGKWMTALDSKINAPFPIPDTPQQDATLVDGATLHRRFFSILNNERVSDYLSPKIEEPLSVALSSALAGVTGYMERSGNDFNQHNQVIVVQWADRNKPVPKSPAYLRPPDRSSKVSAEDWLLKLMINQAFDAAKLTRPGVTSTAPLSSPNADDGSHLWRVNMTLLGGVTTDVIRKHLPRMKERLSIPWATVFKDTSGANTTGVSIVMGAHPEHVSLGNEKRDRPLLVDLEWQKAFAEANVASASTGEVPALVSTHTLEYNDKVRSTTFTLPGMDLAKPRGAIGKLTSATGNAFLQVNADPNSPRQFILLSSRTDPMPENVAFPIQAPVVGKEQVFGVGIDGRPNGVDWSSTPHLLIVGGSGSGKRLSLSTNIPTPTGSTLLADIRVGDQVLGRDGRPCNVTALSEIENSPALFDVTFSDGTVIKADAEHQWLVAQESGKKAVGQANRKLAIQSWESAQRDIGTLTVAAQQSTKDWIDSKNLLAVVGNLNLEANPWQTQAGVLAALHFTDTPFRKVNRQVTRTRTNTSYVARRPFRFYPLIDVITVCEDAWAANPARHQAKLDAITKIKQASEFNPHQPARAVDFKYMLDSELGDHALSRHAVSDPIRRAGLQGETHFIEQHGTLPSKETMTSKVIEFQITTAFLHLAERLHQQHLVRPSDEVAEVRMTTQEMIATGVKTRRGSSRFSIRTTKPLDLPSAELPIGPYSFGAWLGDGTSRTGAITSMDDEIIESVKADGYSVNRIEQSPGRAAAYFFPKLGAALRTLGFATQNDAVRREKEIPIQYLRASFNQRLTLLQGLMDTDGHINSSGNCVLALSSEHLSAGVAQLVRSLGIKASTHIRESSYIDEYGKRVICKDSHSVRFTTDLPVFRLSRKVARLPSTVRVTHDWIYITDITPCSSEPARCISVDSPDHVYLAGEGMTPTSNSVLAQSVMYGALAAGHSVVLIDAQKYGADFHFARRYSSAFCTTVDEARAVMESIYAEVQRRAALNGQYGVSSFDELPESVRPKRMIVFIDEFLGLVSTGSRPPSKPESDPKAEEARLAAERSYMSKRRLAFLVGRVAAEARSAGINLSLMTQKMTANSLPDDLSDLKTNLGRVALGKMSYGDKMSALRDPDASPNLGEIVPKGRLIWESVTAPAVALQGYFSPVDEFEASLASFMGDPADIEHIDFSEHLPDDSSDVIEGRVLVADEAEPTEVADDLLLDLELADVDDAGDSEIPDWAKDFATGSVASAEPAVDVGDDDETPTLDLDELDDIDLSDSKATSTSQAQEPVTTEASEADIDWDAFFAEADTGDTGSADEPDVVETSSNEVVIEQPVSNRNPISVEDVEALVFMDIDGCLAPFGGPARRGQMMIEPAEGTYGDSMAVDPRIMKAVTTIDAPIVWSSAREVEDADVLATHIGWLVLPAIDTAANGPGPHEWFKTNAIVAFLDEVPFVARIVVIDDDDAVAGLGTVLTEAGYDHLIVQPDSAKGLTRDHIAEINSFLAGGGDDAVEAESEASVPAPAKTRRSTRPAKRPRRAAATSRLPSDDEF
ncbi:Homing endonuclease [Brevibacterium sp. 239c]|uniref:HAD domain-containing protein n=1 Tax=Brevibacterium sp. 239c TaxID=1965356 RepID=UPI000C59FE38|nr:HAD domain-containing protein [Brevibacterium sp. 239c]SMY04938.1 Homing endonuclease [Brevibacterium sp. 239c]